MKQSVGSHETGTKGMVQQRSMGDEDLTLFFLCCPVRLFSSSPKFVVLCASYFSIPILVLWTERIGP
ncbi:Taste receptor type 2 member 38 [Frankliniella fusca]|uniref:Taste receptor type 2 member 38 n=1 Tax=Frankliniella fusca TaxID=407009 RepID=A0AAE1I1K8_9NEOP|nr:Taste receptor type 2 member 38 [Frankliniella fusca]